MGRQGGGTLTHWTIGHSNACGLSDDWSIQGYGLYAPPLLRLPLALLSASILHALRPTKKRS